MSFISNYGFRPWLKLMISKKVESSLADNHHTSKIKRSPNITFHNLIFLYSGLCFQKVSQWNFLQSNILIFRTVFSAWLEQARITRKEKENKADRFLLQKWFRLWAKVTNPGVELLFKSSAQVSHRERPKKQAAGDFYEMSLLQKHLARWSQITKIEKRRRYGSNIKATVHYRRCRMLLFKVEES